MFMKRSGECWDDEACLCHDHSVKPAQGGGCVHRSLACRCYFLSQLWVHPVSLHLCIVRVFARLQLSINTSFNTNANVSLLHPRSSWSPAANAHLIILLWSAFFSYQRSASTLPFFSTPPTCFWLPTASYRYSNQKRIWWSQLPRN